MGTQFFSLCIYKKQVNGKHRNRHLFFLSGVFFLPLSSRASVCMTVSSGQGVIDSWSWGMIAGLIFFSFLLAFFHVTVIHMLKECLNSQVKNATRALDLWLAGVDKRIVSRSSLKLFRLLLWFIALDRCVWGYINLIFSDDDYTKSASIQCQYEWGTW